MTTKTLMWALVVVLIVIAAGAYGYRYLVENPPDALVEVVTKTTPPPPLPQGEKAPLTAPEGFTATIFSREVPGARVMIRDPKGTLLVSETGDGKVVALPDQDGDGTADRTVVILEGLNKPHGLLINCPDTGAASADQDGCRLYVAETDTLKSYRYDADTMRASEGETLTTFPSEDGHFTRTLLMHPDGKHILMSIGSSCNVCEEIDIRRASVQSYNLETKTVSTFAAGLRNSVFMATDPVEGDVWATENGRDMIGDDIPPDEVNILSKGKNYGWPICYGDNVHDTDFDTRQYFRDPCADMQKPQIALQAHSAPLGLAFVPEEGWPEAMRNDLLVAYHGSWNRSQPTGYKVVRFDLDDSRQATSGPIDFLTGFLAADASKTDDAIGRPVGLLAEPGGVVYVSDDRAGAIYRIARNALE